MADRKPRNKALESLTELFLATTPATLTRTPEDILREAKEHVELLAPLLREEDRRQVEKN